MSRCWEREDLLWQLPPYGKLPGQQRRASRYVNWGSSRISQGTIVQALESLRSLIPEQPTLLASRCGSKAWKGKRRVCQGQVFSFVSHEERRSTVKGQGVSFTHPLRLNWCSCSFNHSFICPFSHSFATTFACHILRSRSLIVTIDCKTGNNGLDPPTQDITFTCKQQYLIGSIVSQFCLNVTVAIESREYCKSY